MKIPGILASAAVAAMLLPAQVVVPKGTSTGSGSSSTGSGSGGVTLPNIPTNRPPTPTTTNPDVNGRGGFFFGKVAMSDGTPLPSQVVIERVCGGATRPQAYADSRGDFSFQVGQTQDMMADATSSSSNGMGANRTTAQSGTTPFACDLRASLPGYRSDVISMSSRRNLDDPNVGTIYPAPLGERRRADHQRHRGTRTQGCQEGLRERSGSAKKAKVDEAQADYLKATGIYPRYAYAWFELGRVYEQREHIAEARDAYDKSIAADSKFVNPYERLYLLSLKEQNWEDVASTTDKIKRLNPYDFPKAVYYNAVANFQLGNWDLAEKSAREAASMDSAFQNPKIHYVLAVTLANKQDFKGAAECLRTYLKSEAITDRERVTKLLADFEKQVEAKAELKPEP